MKISSVKFHKVYMTNRHEIFRFQKILKTKTYLSLLSQEFIWRNLFEFKNIIIINLLESWHLSIDRKVFLFLLINVEMINFLMIFD